MIPEPISSTPATGKRSIALEGSSISVASGDSGDKSDAETAVPWELALGAGVAEARAAAVMDDSFSGVASLSADSNVA